MHKIVDESTVKEVSEKKLAELKNNANAILFEIRRQLMQKQPFIGSVAMNFELQAIRDVRVETACTDGTSIYFDIDFLSRLSNDERLFVFAHEVWHNVMCHFVRCGCRDQKLFNIATDLEINQLLEKDGLVMPKHCLHPKTFKAVRLPYDQSAEEYYEILLAKQKEMKNTNGNDNEESDNSEENSNGGGSGGVCSGQFDKHIYQGDNSADKTNDGKCVADKYGKVGFDKDFNPSVPKDVVEKMRGASISASQQCERTRGELPAHIKSLIGKLLEPEISWREVLSQFLTRGIGDRREWNPPSRRHIWHEAYMQRRRGEKVRVCVGIDTSGSCQQDLQKFLTEVNGIVKTFSDYEITIICCDAQVGKVETFDPTNPLDIENNSFEAVGGGGTCLRPIFDYIDQSALEFDQMVVFTDGYCEEFAPIDAPKYPVLWVLSEHHNADNLGFGEKVWFKN